MLEIAQIFREHGLKGEMKVTIFSGSPENFTRGAVFKLIPHGEAKCPTSTLTVERLKPFQKYFLVKFKEINEPETGRLYRAAKLCVNESQLKKEEGEAYLFELVGCDIFDGENKIGRVESLTHNGAQVLLEVVGAGELTIPYVPAWVSELDIPNKKIKMKLPEGLIEINKE